MVRTQATWGHSKPRSAYLGAPVGKIRENKGEESSPDKKGKVQREAREGERKMDSGAERKW